MNTIDVGCGPRKFEGAFGIDHHPYPGVDQVIDLNQPNWPIESDRFDRIISRHVIEHVQDIVSFMAEIHRIGKNGATVYIETPHFSYLGSWIDPTHRAHLASEWYKPFQQGQYLSEQTGAFELISTHVTFGKSWRNLIGQWLVKWRGLAKWEKNAFRYPAREIITELRIVK